MPSETFLRCHWTGRTIELHRAHIRAALQFRTATVQDGTDLAAWLRERVISHEQREDRLFDAILGECRLRGIEPPTRERVRRVVRSALRTFETAFFARTLARLPPHARTELEQLIADASEDGEDGSDRHEEAPPTPHVPSLREETTDPGQSVETGAAGGAAGGAKRERGRGVEALVDRADAQSTSACRSSVSRRSTSRLDRPCAGQPYPP